MVTAAARPPIDVSPCSKPLCELLPRSVAMRSQIFAAAGPGEITRNRRREARHVASRSERISPLSEDVRAPKEPNFLGVSGQDREAPSDTGDPGEREPA